MQTPVYLMWQQFGNKTKHLRRIYFDASNDLRFDGWEPQTEDSLEYMKSIGDVEYIEHVNLPLFITGKLPYAMKEIK